MNFASIIKEIETKTDSFSSRQKLISEKVRELKSKTRVNKSLVQRLNDKGREYHLVYMEESKQKILVPEQKLETLRETWTSFKPENINDYEYKLITGLYIWIPALRSDYAYAKINNNIISFTPLKVNTETRKHIVVPEELFDFIGYFVFLPKNAEAFKKKLIRASNRIFKQNFGINIYRHAWASFSNRTMTVADISETAKQMNHSYDVHTRIYTQIKPQKEDKETQTLLG